MLVKAHEYAEIRGRDKSWVSQQIQAGMPAKQVGKRKPEYQIDTAKAIQWEIDRFKADVKPGSQRERLAKAQADKVELENARRRGELILASVVAHVLSSLGADLAARHDGLAGRVANELAGITDAAAIRERLLIELRGVRSAIADGVEKLSDALGSPEGAGPDPTAAARARPQRVGRSVPRAAARKRRARTVE